MRLQTPLSSFYPEEVFHFLYSEVLTETMRTGTVPDRGLKEKEAAYAER